MRVTIAKPRTRGQVSSGSQRNFDSNMKCYQCGERGHFSRDCPDTKYGYRRPPSPSYGRRKNN
jgi:arginine/serine-rich splicing factor 7